MRRTESWQILGRLRVTADRAVAFVLAILDVLGIRGVSLLVGFGGVLAFFLTGTRPTEYPVCDTHASEVVVQRGPVVRVHVEPTCWSGPVTMPGIKGLFMPLGPLTPPPRPFVINWQGQFLEFLTSGGRRAQVTPRAPQMPFELSPTTVFHLRGEGIVTIRIQ